MLLCRRSIVGMRLRLFNTLNFLLAFFAKAVKIKCVIRNLKLHHFAHRILNFLYARIAEFSNLTAARTYHMIVLFAFMRFFELGNVFTKLVFYYQASIQQQLNRVV